MSTFPPYTPSCTTIVPAGAGSRKTWYLKDTLARLIKDKLIAPEKIVAVAFTEAATRGGLPA